MIIDDVINKLDQIHVGDNKRYIERYVNGESECVHFKLNDFPVVLKRFGSVYHAEYESLSWCESIRKDDFDSIVERLEFLMCQMYIESESRDDTMNAE